MRDGTLKLADGRRLGYLELGSPTGHPVVYCHGSPSCRLEPTVCQPAIDGSPSPPRLIAFDRPGFGRSTFQTGRRILDWPSDIEEAVDQLGIDEFSILGASAGSPYALACASTLGRRVQRVGIVVGMAPPEAPGMEASPALTGPSRFRLVRRFQFGMLSLAFKKGRGDEAVDSSIATLGEADQEAMLDPALRSWFEALFAELLTQGGRAAAHEAGLYRKPWGFPLTSIRQHVQLWYGGRDPNVPAVTGRWLAERLPDATFTLWPEHGHFTWQLSREVEDVVSFFSRVDH